MIFKKEFLFLSVIFAGIMELQASAFILKNNTKSPLFFALYLERSLPGFFAVQTTDPVQIASGESLEIKRPESTLILHRRLLVSGAPEILKNKLTHREYKNIASVSISEKLGDVFEITRDDNNLLNIKSQIEPKKNLFKSALSKVKDIKTDISEKVKTPFVPEIAHNVVVRQGTGLCEQEEAFLKKRLPRVNQAINKVIGPCSQEATPIVSVLGSGGGYRAFIGFWGVILGLQELGLWDATTYIAGVSGSTWLLSGLYGSKKSLRDFSDYIRPRLQSNLLTQNIYKAEELLSVFKRKEDFTLVDVWGLLLSKALFGNKKSLGTEVTLSGLQSTINEGQMPLPICTALHRGMSTEVYFEYTPYEVGSIDYKAFIPAAYAGAHFNNGICQQRNFKEYPLGLHCGVFGSAFAADLERISKSIDNKFFSLIARKTRLRGAQLSTGSLVNFMQGIDSMEMSRSPYLKVLDSGQHLNLPMMPIMRRKPDILIIANMTANPKDDEATALTMGIDFARQKGYVMPEYDIKGINTKAVTILYDEAKPDAPLIIFIPNLYGPYSTLKLEYTPKEFNDFCMAIKKAVVDNKIKIYDAFKKVIEKKEAKITAEKSDEIEEIEVKEVVTPGVTLEVVDQNTDTQSQEQPQAASIKTEIEAPVEQAETVEESEEEEASDEETDDEQFSDEDVE